MLIKLKLLFALVFTQVPSTKDNENFIGKLDNGVKKNATLIELMEKYKYKISIDTTKYEYIDIN